MAGYSTPSASGKANSATERRAYWSGEIEKAKKRFRTFHDEGENVVDEYRMQKADGGARSGKDKFNILYSSTETIRPNLYAKEPVVRVTLRNKDTAPPAARDAAELLNSCLQYIVKSEDFDDIMDGVVEDYLLPGLGQLWVRYEPTFEGVYDDDKKPVLGEDGQPQQKLLDEKVCIDYVYWKDFLTGVTRGWKTVPWVAKCCWMTKEMATARFGKEKADKLSYSVKERDSRETDNGQETAEVWEIWQKSSRNVFWYCDSYPTDVLDTKPDPLRLKDFWPCPRPVRAISNTRSFVPRSLFSQYKNQANQINDLTKRIRLLTEALKVVGLFDGSVEKLSNLLNPMTGNQMIPVDGWAAFKGDGGIKGSVEWLPLVDVVNTLQQMIAAREVCKAEIYEITGFSDILRGVSKASETLGAQNIKANWGGARVKRAQKEIQRLARDTIGIAGEVVCEHCEPATIALFGGLSLPTGEDIQANPEAQGLFARFKAAVDLLKSDIRRISQIDVETDSTIMADEEAERADRTAFLAAAGAFLQQAVPAMEATPELGPLLGAMLMFTVRTFPTSQPIEEEFEKVQKAMANRPPKKPDDGGAAIQLQIAQLMQQTEQAKIAASTQETQAKIAAEAQLKQAEQAAKAQAEQNRHDEQMAMLALKDREVGVKERELLIKGRQLDDAAEAAAATVDATNTATAVKAEEVASDAEHDAAELEFQYEELASEEARDEAQAERDEAQAERDAEQAKRDLTKEPEGD